MINCLQVYDIYQQIWENCLQISQLAGIPDSSIPGFLQDWCTQCTIFSRRNNEHYNHTHYRYRIVDLLPVQWTEMTHVLRKWGGDDIPPPKIYYNICWPPEVHIWPVLNYIQPSIQLFCLNNLRAPCLIQLPELLNLRIYNETVSDVFGLHGSLVRMQIFW